MPGVPHRSDNLVLDKAVSAINLTFDRTMNAASFTPDDILRITGPLGDIPLTDLTVTPTNAAGTPLAAGTNSRYFQIAGFETQTLSGTYTIQLGSQISDASGNLLDTNFNAGVGILEGTVTGSDVTTEPYGGDPINVSVPSKGTVTIPLTINDGYLLQRATVNLTITFPTLPSSEYKKLEGRLIAPDGTTVLLFANSPASGLANMTDITFDDSSTSPVQNGVVANGVYDPVQPLAQVINHASQGTWKLVIKNNSSTNATVSKFKLSFDKPVIGTGLGESNSDQTVVSFRIANTDGSADITKDNWTPVGPAPRSTSTARTVPRAESLRSPSIPATRRETRFTPQALRAAYGEQPIS